MSLPDIKRVIKENEVKGVSHLNKKELILKLAELNIPVPEKKPRVPKEPKEPKVIDPKYERLKSIRNNPRKVQMTDVDSGEVTTHKSMYSAARKLGHSSKVINDYDGKVYKGKYEIKVLGNRIEQNPTANISDGSKKQA